MSLTETVRPRAAPAKATPARLELAALDPEVLAELPDSESAYPLTAMQSIMTDAGRTGGRSREGVYHLQQLFRFRDSQASPDAMTRALEVLVAAHPVLRTRLHRTRAGVLVQRVAHEAAVDLRVEDLRAIPPDTRDDAVRQRIMTDRATPFDDAGGPLLRFAWMWTGADQFDLLMSIHHAITDGWGNQALLAQMFELYDRARRGEAVDLAPQHNVFREYVALERETVVSPEAEAFWASQSLPLGSGWIAPRPSPGPTADDGVAAVLDPETTSRLQDLARRHRVTLRAVLLSAYLEVIGAGSEHGTAVAGVVTNGRSDRLSDPLGAVGLFWHMLPIAIDEPGGATSSRLRRIQAELIAIERHGVYPWSQIQALHGGEDAFFATFNFIDYHNSAQLPETGGMERLFQAGHDKFHYPLNMLFAVDRASHRIIMQAQFDPRFFDDAEVSAIMDRIRETLFDYR